MRSVTQRPVQATGLHRASSAEAPYLPYPEGPNRSTLMRPAETCRSLSMPVTASQKAGEPQT